MRRLIEITANIAIIVVCGLLCLTFFTHKGLSFNMRADERPVTHLEGITLPSLPGYGWGSHSKTLVLAVREGCKYCEASLPLYRRLSDLERSNKLNSHRLAVMPDDKISGIKLLQLGGLTVEGVFNQPLSSLQVSGTPTLLLLDSHGRVERAWVGQLNPQGEKDLLAAAEK